MASDPPGPEDDPCFRSSSPCGSCCRRWEPRSLKRKLDDMEVHAAAPAARVEPEGEVAELREAAEGHREMAAQLCAELEEERAASASAASEAMSMILRLQRQKGEAQMEARQFRRFAEEKMEHDRQELAALEELLYEREQAIHELSCEVRAYRDRLLSCGIALGSLESALDSPALEGEDGEGPVSPVSPAIGHGEDLERSPSRASLVDEMEKGVVMGQLPHVLRGEPTCSGEQQEEFHSLDIGGDDDNTSDRVYTVDAVHSGAAPVGGSEQDYVCTTEEQVCRVHGPCEEDVDVRKLEMRLRALEADRESMRQAIISMQADKAQLVLLKEVAQHLCRDVSTHSASSPERNLVKWPFLVWCFSFMSMIKETMKASLLSHLSFMSTTIRNNLRNPIGQEMKLYRFSKFQVDHVLCFLEKEDRSKQVYTWAIEQRGLTVTFRKCPTDTTVEMSLKSESSIRLILASRAFVNILVGLGLVAACEKLCCFHALWTLCDLIG